MTSFPFQEPLPPEALERLEKLLAPRRLTEYQRAILLQPVALSWSQPPQPYPLEPLQPYLRAMNRDLLTLSQATQVPIRFMTGAPIPLRDRIWARFQAFRRLLRRAQERLRLR